jgi:hypothetical protein
MIYAINKLSHGSLSTDQFYSNSLKQYLTSEKPDIKYFAVLGKYEIDTQHGRMVLYYLSSNIENNDVVAVTSINNNLAIYDGQEIYINAVISGKPQKSGSLEIPASIKCLFDQHHKSAYKKSSFYEYRYRLFRQMLYKWFLKGCISEQHLSITPTNEENSINTLSKVTLYHMICNSNLPTSTIYRSYKEEQFNLSKIEMFFDITSPEFIMRTDDVVLYTIQYNLEGSI